jgi:hypothetical protein
MAEEFAHGDYILLLEGRTLEVFRRTSSESMRYHVDFVRVNGKARGDGFRIRLGAAIGEDDVTGGIHLDLSQAEYGRFSEFIAMAIVARDNG